MSTNNNSEKYQQSRCFVFKNNKNAFEYWKANRQHLIDIYYDRVKS